MAGHEVTVRYCKNCPECVARLTHLLENSRCFEVTDSPLSGSPPLDEYKRTPDGGIEMRWAWGNKEHVVVFPESHVREVVVHDNKAFLQASDGREFQIHFHE